ncbi:helicase conserved C-terminal domain protein [Mycobacterium xenopi 3993]|nr:helicase conserved C-terminal domain protein [Mycobacterium xenopi 3993]
MDALTRVLEVEPFEAMIVFVRTKQATEEVAEKLRARGFSAAAINGDIPQTQRERTITALKDGGLDILVATDVAARGLDVDRVSHVLNYDIPHDTESYVHRIGRTGRAGRSGTALLFVSPRERHLLKAIEKATRQRLIEAELPTVDDVNAQRVAKFADSITDALGSPGMELFRSLVEDYEREHDVPMVDIAAALALQSRDGEEFLMAPEPRSRRDRVAPSAARQAGAHGGNRNGDLSHRRRQTTPSRSGRDRRCYRQRRRFAPQRFRPHHDRARLLPGRIARPAATRDAEGARTHPHLRRTDQPAADRATRNGRRRDGAKPRRKPAG